MQPRRQIRFARFFPIGFLSLCLILGIWLLNNAVTLQAAAKKPVGALFVLGGSITREIYVAELAKQYPQTPILISKGSKDPCILLIFQRAQTSSENVWLEKCADSTFDNFYYGLPILKDWQVEKLKLITSKTHLPRAQWLAQIILGAHGMWVELDIVKEKGVPGNRENFWVTGFDVTRSLFWAVISQFWLPQCGEVTPLSAVDLEAWKAKKFKCEHQANLKY
jgi:uncharacterized SAM-binding protein YcdF (DUF218 family)